ncbi:MAG: hypothetical protein R2867_22795 [Caldilineaceae bacterium]
MAGRNSTYSYIYPQIRLSNDDSHFYFEDVVSHTADGKRQFLETAEPLDKYIVGVDGQTYLVSQTAIFQAQIAETGVTFAPYAHWDTLSLGAGFRLPQDAGVLPDGRIWIFYAGQYEVGKFLWLERTGAVDALIDLPWNQGSAYLVGLDGQASVYLCGLRQIASNNRFTECRAYRAGQSAPLWTAELAGTVRPVGGALVADRLYVATSDGSLIALGDE